MNDALTVAKEQVRDIVRELKALDFRLLGVQASLPPSPAETIRFQDVEEMDPITELRGVIGCVLHESIRPAVNDLEEVTKEPERKGLSCEADNPPSPLKEEPTHG